MISSAKIIFFSGTGCTALCAATLQNAFTSEGVESSVYELKGKRDNALIYSEELLILMYPVHSFDAPLPLYEFVERLAEGANKRVAIIGVSGGGEVLSNRASHLGIQKILEEKQYLIQYVDTIVMPCNTLIYTPAPAAAALVKALPAKCKDLAQNLRNGTPRQVSPPLIDRLFAKSAKYEQGNHGRVKFGERLTADESCTACGLCADMCPRNNISLIDNTPKFGSDCVICLRCIYSCPSNALHAGYGSSLVLKNGFDLSVYKQEPDDLNIELRLILKGPLWAGVRRYIERYSGINNENR